MSEQVERRLYAMLGEPTESPYGNPIPGLEAIGGPTLPEFMSGVASVTTVLGEEPVTATIRRLGEPLQVDIELLQQIKDAGIRPGAVATVSREGRGVWFAIDGHEPLGLPIETASHIFVAQG